MASGKNTTVLYVIIAVLVMGLAASIGYNFGNGNMAAVSSSNASMNAINTKVLKEIEDLKNIYDSKIAEKKATYSDLEAEKKKVQQLLAELEQTKGDANALLKYKEEYQNLESKMHILVDEIVVLKANKSKAVTKVKRAKPLMLDARKSGNGNSFGIKNKRKNVTASKQQNTETKTIVVEANETKSETSIPKTDPSDSERAKQIPERKAEKTYVNVNASNLKAAGYISKSGSNREETDSASKTDLIKISFYIDANPNAKAEEKKYFIQVVDANNKVLGKRITEFFDDKSITYSLTRTVQYDNQYLAISQELIADDFAKGTYTVNVYERSRLIGKTTFKLK